MHLSDGEIKAFQDQELSAEERQKVNLHLATCPLCMAKSDSLHAASQQVHANLSTLDPETRQGHLTTTAARSRLSVRIQEKEVISMWDKLFSRQAHLAWIALAVITLLAISLAFAPVRAIATSFLGLFRVEQFSVVEINPGDLPEQLGTSSNLELLLAQNIEIEERGDAYSVTDKESASQSVNFDVRLPTGMSKPLSSLKIQPGGRVAFTVDAARVEAILNEINRTDIQIPAGVDGAEVALDISETVAAQYGNCEFDPETLIDPDDDPLSSPIPRLPDCVTLVQAPSPTISAPPGLNLTEIGEAYLQLLGMSPEEAEHFAKQVDWTSTFVIPMPMYGTSFEEIPVDGVTGILILQELEDHTNQYMLMWVKDGITYVLTGPGGPSTASLIVRSLR